MKEANRLIEDCNKKYNILDYQELENVDKLLLPNREYLVNITPDECFLNASQLLSYKFLADKNISQNTAIVELLKKYVSQIHGKYWNNTPDMTPADIRREMINNDQSYLQPILKEINIRETESRYTNNLLYNISQQIRFYEELGKLKRWENNS